MTEKRDLFIQVRVSIKEKKQLKAAAKRCHLTLSEYLRKTALHAPVQAFPIEKFHEIYSLVDEMKGSIYSVDRDYLEWYITGICRLMRELYTQEVVNKTVGNDEDLGD